jgi:hypothetical protein
MAPQKRDRLDWHFRIPVKSMTRARKSACPRFRARRGRPIIITRNDYQLTPFNGDVGLPVDTATASPEAATAHSTAVFLGAGGSAPAPPPERPFAVR